MNCLLAGVGGQGTVLASKILAQCALNRGEAARTAETIGMAQRGGSVVSHVRIGTGAYSPLIPLGEADLIIAFEPAEAVRALPYLKIGGSMVVNKRAIKPVSDALSSAEYRAEDMLEYLASHVSRLKVVDGDAVCEALGSHKILNLVLLGAAAKNGSLPFTEAELIKVVDAVIPLKYRELNKKAITQV